MITKTELANLDDLMTEAHSAASVVEVLSAAMGELTDWAGALSDRWAEAGWGTAKLDTAITEVSEAVAALKTPDAVLEHLHTIQAELSRARAIGEAVNAAGATGNLSRFTSDPSTSTARRARAGRRGAGPVDAASPPAGPGDVEARVRQAYLDLAGEPGESWISMVRLREHLSDVPRAELDAALQNLSREAGVHLQGEANQQTLTAADREAAVEFGGSSRHIFKLEVSPREAARILREREGR